VYAFVLEADRLRTTITSIGLPILTPDGRHLIRGPKVNIPESIHHEIAIDDGDIDKWANKGWVDLRPASFASWQERFLRMRRSRHLLHTRGTSSITMKTYLTDSIEIGAVVAWIFNNEAAGYRIK